MGPSLCILSDSKFVVLSKSEAQILLIKETILTEEAWNRAVESTALLLNVSHGRYSTKTCLDVN